MGIDALSGTDLAIVLFAALLAGALDASVGSGGAVLLPAVIGVSPAGVSAAVPLAMNKAVAVAGNLVAAHRYRHLGLRHLGAGLFVTTTACALAGVLLGVWIATLIDVGQLTWIAAGALTALVIALLVQGFRRGPATAHPSHAHRAAVPVAVGGIAVYDGVIGPATGSLLQIALHKLLGRPMHECLALARLIQGLLNLTAAIVLWIVVAPDLFLVVLLAVLHALGGWAGAIVTRRIPATVLHYILIGSIAVSVLRMLLVR